MGDTDFLSMSDEDFEKQPMPVGEAAPASGSGDGEGAPSQAAEEVGSEGQEQLSQESNENSQADATEGGSDGSSETGAPATEEVASGEPNAADGNSAATAEQAPASAQSGADAGKPEGEQKKAEAAEPVASATDFEAFYKQIMTPFKANGRTVELKSPEEAIQLMQMGANYTKKMQELVPHRKVLTMLQNNGLLDEDKLSFLIDIERKDPEAIKKLINDAGLDPMEIDTSTEPAYQEGNHRVSDEEVAFHTTLDEMKSTPERLETLKAINDEWDQASKEALWSNPGIMGIIHQQRSNGIYDRINAEVNRRRVLGSVPANVPFLQAYKVVGDELTAANAFADLVPPAPKQVAVPPGSNGQVVTTRVAAPKAAVANNDRAAAASTSRQTAPKAKAPAANPLAMSDDEFLKQFEGRV